MKPIVSSYDCTDHDPIDVGFWMNSTIFPDSKGGDSFQVHVVAPNSLDGTDSAKYAIGFNDYAWPEVIAAVDVMLEQCQGTN